MDSIIEAEHLHGTTFVALRAAAHGRVRHLPFSSAGDINRERYSGTLALLFAAPAGFPAIVLGKILGNTFLSLASIGISVATAALLFGVPVAVASPGYFLLALICALAAFAAFSLVIACLLTLSRRTELYMNCIEIPLILLCGFVYPVSALPTWLRPVSYALSPTWAVELLRMGVWGRGGIRRHLAGSWRCSSPSRRFRRSLPWRSFAPSTARCGFSPRWRCGEWSDDFSPRPCSFIKAAPQPSLWWNFCASIPFILW